LSDSLVPALEEALRTCEDPSRIKALVLSNPHNPFARCYPEHVLTEAIHWCADHRLHYISDEVYALSDFSRVSDTLSDHGHARPEAQNIVNRVNGTAMESNSITPFVSALALQLGADRIPPISVIWSTSKDLGSSGFRMGVHVLRMRDSILHENSHTKEKRVAEEGPSLLTTSIGLLSTTQLPTISMFLTHALLTSNSFDALVLKNRQRLYRHHSVVTRRLQNWGVPFIPATSGPYLLAQLGILLKDGTGDKQGDFDSEGLNGTDLLRSKSGVSVAAGKSFHMRGQSPQLDWVRITFAVPMDVLEDGLDRIEGAFDLREPRKPSVTSCK
jgi:aspartate/methionine/tyrosine aminotransferase